MKSGDLLWARHFWGVVGRGFHYTKEVWDYSLTVGAGGCPCGRGPGKFSSVVVTAL